MRIREILTGMADDLYYVSIKDINGNHIDIPILGRDIDKVNLVELLENLKNG